MFLTYLPRKRWNTYPLLLDVYPYEEEGGEMDDTILAGEVRG